MQPVGPWSRCRRHPGSTRIEFSLEFGPRLHWFIEFHFAYVFVEQELEQRKGEMPVQILAILGR